MLVKQCKVERGTCDTTPRCLHASIPLAGAMLQNFTTVYCTAIFGLTHAPCDGLPAVKS